MFIEWGLMPFERKREGGSLSDISSEVSANRCLRHRIEMEQDLNQKLLV